jgi:hypothetical protein
MHYYSSVADPHHLDADPDPDPACHFDTDPDPDPTFHIEADPDPSLAVLLHNVAAHNVSIRNVKVSKRERHITYSVTYTFCNAYVMCTLVL